MLLQLEFLKATYKVTELENEKNRLETHYLETRIGEGSKLRKLARFVKFLSFQSPLRLRPPPPCRSEVQIFER